MNLVEGIEDGESGEREVGEEQNVKDVGEREVREKQNVEGGTLITDASGNEVDNQQRRSFSIGMYPTFTYRVVSKLVADEPDKSI